MGWGLRGYISGGKPVWVAIMYWPRARMRDSSDQTGLPSSKEDTSRPKLMPGGCPYIGVLPSTLTLCDSYFVSHDS